MKQCTNCRGNLADFVTVCPYCHVTQPVPQAGPYQPQWDATPQSSNKALASLICGILFLCAPASIAAVVLGHLALVDIKRSAGRMSGQGLAIAGLVMGYLGIGLIAIYMVVMMFAVRNAMRQNVPANESVAIASMKSYDQALKAYAAKCPQQGFPATLSALGPGNGDCAHANLMGANMANGRPVKQGYRFVYTPGTNGAQRVAAFALVARPAQPGVTGKRYFFMDEAGVVRQSDSYIVGPRSPPVVNPEAESDTGKDDNQPPDGEQNPEEARKNEAAAISTMRVYNQALTKYAKACPQQGYPATLPELKPGSGVCKHSNLIDPQLAVQEPTRQGYIYKYSTGVMGPEKVTVFVLVARPASPGSSGGRFFYLDEGGIIRESPTQIIGPNSKPLNDEQDANDNDVNDHGSTPKTNSGKPRKSL
ncbi:MAG TPA: DUF4190 domain-containing protein [Candidatus Acidoferrum sp.]